MSMTRPFLLTFCLFLLPGMLRAEEKNWTVTKIPTAVAASCAVVTPTRVLDDGYGQTHVQILVGTTFVKVKTDSKIDTSFSDIGLKVDKNNPIAMNRLDGEQIIRFDDQRETVVEQFKKGAKVTLRLRFWPSWPTKGLKTVDFSLRGFTKAYAAMMKC